MKPMLRVIFLFLGLEFALFAQEYAVVANKKMKFLSKEEIRAIYLRKITYIEDTQMVPLNLETSSELREAFEKQILNMSYERLKSYWTKQHYLGHRPPLIVKSQESVIMFVKKVEGAIGYIEKEKVNKDLQVLYTWDDGE